MCDKCNSINPETHEHSFQFYEDLCNGDYLVACSACKYKFPIENSDIRHCPNKRCNKILVYRPWCEW